MKSQVNFFHCAVENACQVRRSQLFYFMLWVKVEPLTCHTFINCLPRRMGDPSNRFCKFWHPAFPVNGEVTCLGFCLQPQHSESPLLMGFYVLAAFLILTLAFCFVRGENIETIHFFLLVYLGVCMCACIFTRLWIHAYVQVSLDMCGSQKLTSKSNEMRGFSLDPRAHQFCLVSQPTCSQYLLTLCWHFTGCKASEFLSPCFLHSSSFIL